MQHEPLKKLIENTLNQAFSLENLEVIDESHLHIGHPGAKQGGGHFHVIMTCPTLNQLPRLDAHRQIYQALGNLMKKQIHALKITIRS